jgi:hypothetical protein
MKLDTIALFANNRLGRKVSTVCATLAYHTMVNHREKFIFQSLMNFEKHFCNNRFIKKNFTEFD